MLGGVVPSERTQAASAEFGATELRDSMTELLSPEDRKLVRRCLILLAVLSAGSMLGSASSLYLVNELPLLLIVLSPIGRNLILAVPNVNPVVFVVVATCRRALFYIPCFYLGRKLGPAGLAWLEERAPGAERFIRWLERIFDRARHPAVFFLLGPAMSTIAGNSGMSVRVWLPLILGGLVLRMVATVLFGEVFREPIEWLLELIDEYKLPGTIVIVLAIVAYQVRKRTRSR
jgi:membrane protein DedA with SNARE-associated domain